MTKKVTFVLNVRYPTEKAYGVTTGLTAKAIAETGMYSVEVITPKLDRNHESFVNTIEVGMPLPIIYNYIIEKKNTLGPYVFNIWKLFYPIRLITVLKHKDNLIWLRDIYTALVLSLLGYQTVCEVHRTPSIINRVMLSALKILPKTTVILISKNLQEKLKISIKNSVVAPMAVYQSEILGNKEKKLNSKVTIGYIGSPHSSGIALSLQSIIEAALIFESSNPNIIFRLVGISKTDFLNIEFPSNIEFVGRLPRSKSLKAIDDFDIGLVIYPDNKYFEDSFPIKIVEYAARCVPIVASNTTAHRNILGENKALFFDLSSDDSLAKCIIQLLNDSTKRESIILNSSYWVKQLTYQKRIERVLLKAKF
jgi:glycosyltransferase involved in cell wall biosynthesis